MFSFRQNLLLSAAISGCVTLTCFSVLAVAAGEDGNKAWPPAVWTQPTAAFHIAGPLYYVGGRELTAYYIASQDCNVLVNVGMSENVALVRDSILSLGFKPEELDYLLITQAHFDHAGGAFEVAQWGEVQVLAGPGDALLMQRGGLDDYVFGDTLSFPAVPTARGALDGEHITCGAVDIEVVASPGHTPGSTSWRITFEENEVQKVALIAASISVLPNAQLIDNQHYPNVVSDFRKTYTRLTQQHYDYYLPDHMVFIDPKTADGQSPQASWFSNQDALPAFIQRSQTQLEQLLQQQQETGR